MRREGLSDQVRLGKAAFFIYTVENPMPIVKYLELLGNLKVGNLFKFDEPIISQTLGPHSFLQNNISTVTFLIIKQLSRI